MSRVATFGLSRLFRNLETKEQTAKGGKEVRKGEIKEVGSVELRRAVAVATRNHTADPPPPPPASQLALAESEAMAGPVLPRKRREASERAEAPAAPRVRAAAPRRRQLLEVLGAVSPVSDGSAQGFSRSGGVSAWFQPGRRLPAAREPRHAPAPPSRRVL